MLRLASLAIVVAHAAPGVAAPAARGKVVRVERHRSHLDERLPTVCEVKNDPSGFCIGKSPAIGQRAVIVDDARVIAELRVSKVSSLNVACDMLWSVGFEVTTGDLANVRASKAIALISDSPDVRLVRRLNEDRAQAPSRNPHERVLIVLDRDRDQRPDLYYTAYYCDAGGVPVASGTQQAVDNCVDIWSHLGKQPRRISHTKFATCIAP